MGFIAISSQDNEIGRSFQKGLFGFSNIEVLGFLKDLSQSFLSNINYALGACSCCNETCNAI
jgi:hypothetical protein